MLRNIIILAAVAVVVIAAFIILPKLEPKEEEETATAEPTEDPALYIFSEYTTEDVEKLTLDDNGEKTVLLYDDDGETIVVQGHEDIAIDQSEASNVFYTAAYVEVEKIVTEDMSDLAQFGLEEPTLTVTAIYNDGKANVFYFGNKVPGSGQYYMMMEGVDKVFVVWNNYGNNAQTKLDDLVEIETKEMTIDDVSELSITKAGETLMSFKNYTDIVEIIDMGEWKLTEPYYRSIETSSDESVWEAIYTEIFDLLSVDDVLDSLGNIKEYGLAEPWVTVDIVKLDGTELSILISEGEDGTHAMKFSDSDIIYEIASSDIGFLDYEPFDVVEKLLMLVNIKYVSEIKMTGVLGDNVLEVTQTESLDDDGNPREDSAGDPIMNTGYVVEGVALTEDEEEQGSWFYQTILSAKVLREAESDFVPGEPVGSIQLTLIEEPYDYLIEIYEYDDYFYAVKFLDNDVLFVVNKEDIQAINETYEQLKTREVEKPY